MVGSDHAVATTHHAEFLAPFQRKVGGGGPKVAWVVVCPENSRTIYIRTGPVGPPYYYYYIYTSLYKETTHTTLGTFRPYGAERSVVGSVADCPGVAPRPHHSKWRCCGGLPAGVTLQRRWPHRPRRRRALRRRPPGHLR